MNVDESGAPWPYGEPRPREEAEPPTWECPGGTCDCHPVVRDEELVDHTIFFFDHEVRRMPGARCRVLENGRMINLAAPYARSDGSIVVRLRPTTRHLFLEWAPADTPVAPPLPYRSRYHVMLGEATEERVRLRLANIGFVAERDLSGNVADFEHHYTESVPPTREPSAIEGLLVGYHDTGTLPPLGTKVSTEERLPLAPSLAKSGGAKKDAAAPKPTKRTKQAPSGCAASVYLPKLKVNLAIRFHVTKDDLSVPEQRTIEALADPEKILAEYERGRGAIPIEMATLVALDDGKEIARSTSDAQGWVTVDLAKAKAGARVRVIAVPPDQNALDKKKGLRRRLQLNPTNAPAAPSMPGADFTLPKLFRLFIIELRLNDDRSVRTTPEGLPDLGYVQIRPGKAPELDADGALDASKVKPIGFLNAKPKFASITSVGSECLQKESGSAAVFHVDWRPDWWKSENTSPRYDPWNRFKADTKSVPATAPPSGIVIHHTHGVQMPSTVVGLVKKPADPKPGQEKKGATSAHYVIDLDGHAIKLVEESRVSFHAGTGQWGGFDAPNYFTVGFEIVHSDSDFPGIDGSYKLAPREFFQEQYDALIRICLSLKSLYGIRPQHVVGHRDVKVLAKDYLPEGTYPNGGYSSRTHGGKPDCPGMSFQWEQLEEAGLSLKRSETPVQSDMEEDEAINLYMTAPSRLSPTEPKTWTRQRREDVAQLLLQYLFDIGYSVSDASKHPPRDKIKGDFGQLAAAGSAFQTHHFSGSRRAYNHESWALSTGAPAPRTAALATRPRIRTIDDVTIRAILEAWWAWRKLP